MHSALTQPYGGPSYAQGMPPTTAMALLSNCSRTNDCTVSGTQLTVIPKEETLYYIVVGEQLRRLYDASASGCSYVWGKVTQIASGIDSIFTRLLSIIPGAQAERPATKGNKNEKPLVSPQKTRPSPQESAKKPRVVQENTGVRLTEDDLRRISRDAENGIYTTHERIIDNKGGPGTTEIHDLSVMDIDWGEYPSDNQRKPSNRK